MNIAPLPKTALSFSIGSEPWVIVERATDEIIGQIQPTVASEERRRKVIDYVHRLLKSHILCELMSMKPVVWEVRILLISLLPPVELEKKKHKLKRLVQSPKSFFMDVKCQGCFNIMASTVGCCIVDVQEKGLVMGLTPAACVQATGGDYISQECSQKLLNCMDNFQRPA